MKRLIIFSVMQLSIAFLFTAVLTAQEYSANIDKTSVVWKGSKVVSGNHEGTVALKSAKLMLEEGLLTSGEMVIDMTTIVDTDLDEGMKARLEGHLKSDDFFGVEKYPLASFVVSSSKSLEDNKISVSGDLTIKGKTNSLTFISTVEDAEESVLFTGVIEVDRSLYDVRYGSGKFFDNLGDKAINDIFTLEFRLYME